MSASLRPETVNEETSVEIVARTKLPASHVVHDTLFISRSSLVTVGSQEHADMLARDMLQIRGGPDGRAVGRLGVLFMSAKGLFFGGERAHDRRHAKLAALEQFADKGEADERLIIIRGMDAHRRALRGEAEVVEKLATILNEPDKPMLLAICTGSWRVSPESASPEPGDPDTVIRRIRSGIELNDGGEAISFLTEPREFAAPRASVFRNVREIPSIQVPQGAYQL